MLLSVDRRDKRRIGLFATLATAFIWAWPTVFIKMLSYDFDVFTQSFYRYLASSLFLFLLSMLFVRDDLRNAAKNIKILVVPAILVTLFQMFNVTGVYMANASVVGIVSRINIVFIVLFSYLIFEEERKTIRSRYFLIANIFVIGGIMGLVLGAHGPKLEFNLGVVIVILGAIFWAAYIISLKRIANRVGPLGALPFIQLLAALFFLPIVLLVGAISRVTSVSSGSNLLLVISGIFCVGLGNTTNYIAIRHLGSTIPANILSFKPILTIIFAYIILGEVLTTAQFASGILLLLGCWIIIRKLVTR